VLRIGVLNGDRNALALFINAENYELSRFLLPRNAWSFNHKALDTGRKKFCMDDFEHMAPRRGNDGFPDITIVFGVTREGCD
jgi:hypothetical protein